MRRRRPTICCGEATRRSRSIAGSRGLGRQIGTEFLRDMAPAALAHGIQLPDREPACARINFEVGE
jgi:RNA-splicing ligase RtcB